MSDETDKLRREITAAKSEVKDDLRHEIAAEKSATEAGMNALYANVDKALSGYRAETREALSEFRTEMERREKRLVTFVATFMLALVVGAATLVAAVLTVAEYAFK